MVNMSSSQPLLLGNSSYRYKLVATQISQDAGLAAIPYTGQKFLPPPHTKIVGLGD